MKLKQRPGDFQVTEDFHFSPAPKGEHYVHVLTKEKLDTMQALARVAHVAQIPRTAIAFAGLKDRQGITEQWISLPVQMQMDEPNLSVRFVGRSDQAVTSKQSQGNRFKIVVRDLRLSEAGRLRRNLPALAKAGLPNYFDDQRFGCLRHNQGFIVRDLLRGHADRALHALVAQPSEHVEAGDTRLKQLLSKHWGDWVACRDIARGPHYQPVFQHLVKNPRDFVGALAKVTQRLKLIHLYAFQSWLWNRAVTRYLERFISDRERLLLPSLCGELTAWRYLDEDRDRPDMLMAKQLPLIAPTTEFSDRLYRAMVLDLLVDEGLTLPRLEGVEQAGMVFKEELRPVVLKPLDLRVGPLEQDEENRARSKVRIEFALPRGAYATLVIKRLFAEPVRARSDREPWPSKRPPPRQFRPHGRAPRGAPHGAPRGNAARSTRRDDRGPNQSQSGRKG